MTQFLPATHTFIHNWNESYLPLVPSRTKRHRTLWPVLISVPMSV